MPSVPEQVGRAAPAGATIIAIAASVIPAPQMIFDRILAMSPPPLPSADRIDHRHAGE
jgi:hypothetical protein